MRAENLLQRVFVPEIMFMITGTDSAIMSGNLGSASELVKEIS